MTVQELITKLQTYPPDAKVELNDPEGTCNYFYINLEYRFDQNVVELYGNYQA